MENQIDIKIISHDLYPLDKYKLIQSLVDFLHCSVPALSISIDSVLGSSIRIREDEVGANDGMGVGLPASYVGYKEGIGVGLRRLYVGDKEGIGVGGPDL